jgi:hypothetical protein
MRHKWDGIINKKKRFKTCIICKTVYVVGWPSFYYRPYTDEPFFRAGDCIEILNKSKKLNEAKSRSGSEGK